MGDTELARAVSDAIPALLRAIPVTPAAGLGRAGVAERHRRPPRRQGLLPVVVELTELPAWVVERIHGALERPLAELSVDVPAGAVGGLPAAVDGSFFFAQSASEAESVRAVRWLVQVRPGAVDVVTDLVTRIADHEAVRSAIRVRAGGSEAEIAAAHGAGQLAVAVMAAVVALREVGHGDVATVVGTALGVAAERLRGLPMPAGYDDAVLAKRRAEYVLPRYVALSVPASGHRIVLAEGPVPETVDFAANGLVTAVDGGIVIRTGTAEGPVRVSLQVLPEAPVEVDTVGWQEIVELSWHARRGAAALRSAGQAAMGGEHTTPPWPGDYRARVHAYGRDDEGRDHYEVVVWSAPSAAPIVHSQTDRLGHRLRGETEPPVVVRPEWAYRWVESSRLCVAATVTVVVGVSVADVLAGFGADLEHGGPIRELREQDMPEPWLTVLEVDGVVLVVEENGFTGSLIPVLNAVSERGRAASMFWNVNGVTSLSFARDGNVLSSAELGYGTPPDDPEVLAALVGLDFEDFHDKRSKGLVAVERFTGRGLKPVDLERIEVLDVAYPITPRR